VPRRGELDLDAFERRLRQLCRDQLAGYKQPRLFEFRSELPQTPAGKIIKREIRVT
jgi:long-chain acyl-CoA synthetase